MKSLILTAGLFLLLSMGVRAQDAALDTMGYKMSVVSNVKDVMAAVPITAAKQVQLADFFQREEALISGAVNNGSSGITIQQLKDQLVAEFQSILTAGELSAYRQRRKDSIFARAASPSN